VSIQFIKVHKYEIKLIDILLDHTSSFGRHCR